MSQKIDADAIRQLANILKETGLSEIEYECAGSRIYISKNSQVVSSIPHQTVQNTADTITNTTPEQSCIRSPMVGTVYLSHAPGAEAFIKVGSNVKAGDTVLIVEAMKIMNPIKAIKNGTVTKILVQDGKPVEYDEILILIDENL